MSVCGDVEKQEPAARSRRVDALLTAAVTALFVLFGLALTGALLYIRRIEREIKGRPDGSAHAHIAPENTYKMENFAYVRASESALKNDTVMAWESFPYAKGHTVGSLYHYDKKQEALDVKNSGVYFLYVQLSLSCTADCTPGQFSISFYNQDHNKELSCTVSLPGESDRPVSQTCWRVVIFPEDTSRLLARTEIHGTLNHWQLDLNDSGFGVFLVDGLPVSHQTGPG